MRDVTWTGGMTMLGYATGAIGDPERARLLYGHLAPYCGRMSWVGTCTLGPIDLALAIAARTMGSEPDARVHAHKAKSLPTRFGAKRFAERAGQILS